jgi:recombination protein RecR
MLTESPAMQALIEALLRLPGIGKRSAQRLALHLLGAPEDEARALSDSIRLARERVTTCSVCCNLTEANPCSVCGDPRRDHAIVCVIERPAGAIAIEKSGAYRGMYHVLHGALSPLDGVGPSQLRIDSLMKRLEAGEIKEVIVATNATAEGEATAMYLSGKIAPLGIAVTRIAQGVPMGGGLEFSDDITLTHALQGRMSFR